MITKPALIFIGLMLSAGAWADAPNWSELPEDQRQVLAGFEARWDSLPEERRQHLANRAERWCKLPDERKQAIRARWQELKDLPPHARDALRERWHALSPEERREVVRQRREREND